MSNFDAIMIYTWSQFVKKNQEFMRPAGYLESNKVRKLNFKKYLISDNYFNMAQRFVLAFIGLAI